MASRFVSGGAIDAGTGEAVAALDGGDDAIRGASAGAGIDAATSQRRTGEWEAVQRELDAERRRREEQRRADGAGGEKSLYEVLEANKAAKQAAFEEAHRIRNQFRALDDEEIEFLDGVADAQRADEARRRREEEEGVDEFRREQLRRERELELDEHHGGGGGGADRDRDEDGDGDGDGGWDVGGGSGRKRKRREDKGAIIKGVKRRASGSEKAVAGEAGRRGGDAVPAVDEDGQRSSRRPDEGQGGQPASVKGAAAAPKQSLPAPAAAAAKPKPGLVDYGSDDDDD